MLLERVPIGRTVGLCANALDNVEPDVRARLLVRERDSLEALCYRVVELDLRGRFADRPGLLDDLAPLSLVWAIGGNSFVLNLAMRLSGLADALPGLLDDGSLVYGGYSAGAVVAGTSLRGIELLDRTDDFPAHYPSREVLWDGLGLVEGVLVPHYESNHRESTTAGVVVARLRKEGIPFHALRDGEVLTN